MPLIATPDSSPLPRVTSISAKMNGCTASTSGSMLRAVFITSAYSANVACDFSTITCALTPSTLSRNSFWKPVVTASTIVSAATPSATPSTDTLVNTLNADIRPNTAVEIRPSTNISTATEFAPFVSTRRPSPATVTSAENPAKLSIKRSRLPP